jgi:broad specificity phosphatase PhoE
MKLIFIRHGDPDYKNDTLTEKGWREAEYLSHSVSNLNIKDIYCSPLGRAKATASLSLQKLNREAVIKEWLKEFIVLIKDPSTEKDRIPWDFMPDYWTNQPDFYDKDKWMDAEIMQSGPIRDEYQKACDGLDEVLKEHGYSRFNNYYKTEQGNEDVLVFFCHLGTTCIMLSHLLGISASVLWHGFYLAPTSVTVLCTEEREQGNAYFRCKVMGDTTHLHDAGEELSNAGSFQEIY